MHLASSIATVLLVAAVVGCECGPDLELVSVSGQGTISTSVDSTEELYTGGFDQTGSTEAGGDAAKRFVDAREALRDPSSVDAAFGFEAVGGDPTSGRVTGTGMLVELVFPLTTGASIQFSTDGTFSPTGANAPMLKYIELRSGQRVPLDVDTARGTVTSVNPLSLELDVRFVDGSQLEGTLSLQYDRTESCD